MISHRNSRIAKRGVVGHRSVLVKAKQPCGKRIESRTWASKVGVRDDEVQVWLAARKAWVDACHGAQHYLQIGEERDDGTRFRCSEGEPCAHGKLGYTGRFNISLHQTLTSYTAVRAHAPIKEHVRPPYRDADEQLIRIRSVPYSDVLVPPVHLWTRDLPACIRSASAASSRKPKDIMTGRELTPWLAFPCE